MAKKLEFPDGFRPDFTGFSPSAFSFLSDLAANNERGWFQEHRQAYEDEVRFPMECLAAEFGADRGLDLPVRGDPGRAMFRIHRDVRFSNNKSPYKTHAGAVLSRSGQRGEQGIVYIHIQPGGCFVSAGFWRPDPPLLAAWRGRMAEKPQEWLDIAGPHSAPGKVPFMRTITALKTLPRGFKEHADSPAAEYLKWKSFLLTRPVSDEEAAGRGLIDIIDAHARDATPLLQYGWALEDRPGGADPRPHMREN